MEHTTNKSNKQKSPSRIGKFLKSLFMPWEEVYSSTDLAEVMKRETILSSHGIRFKVTDDSLRLSRNNHGGSEGMALSRASLQKVTYRLFVKQDRAETAKYQLYQKNP